MLEKEPIIKSSEDVTIEKVDKGEAVFIQRLMTDEDDVENCFMRIFTIKSGGHMPSHEHETTDHVQFVLRGKMKVNLGGDTSIVKEGNSIYIPPNTPHSYENLYDEEVKFICVVPKGDIMTKILE